MKKSNFKRGAGPVMAAALAAAVMAAAVPLSAGAAQAADGTRTSAVQASVSVPDSAATLTFTDSGISASGAEDGYKISGTGLTIDAPGVYTITGACSEGSVNVKKGTTGVTLILRDLSLASGTTAPLSCNKTTEVTLYAVGTVTLTDREDPANENSADEAAADAFEGAAIKVKSGASLTITGAGTLTADGSACKNGIKGASGSSVTVEGNVTLNVRAANNGIADDNAVVINSGTVNVTAGNDGIKAEPDEGDAASAGTVTVNGGTITIDAQGDGIQAAGDVTITGGVFNITAFGGAKNAKALGEDSAKGVKSDSAVIISGGSFTVDSADDAIHANGDVTVTGGTYDISAGDDAFHADNDLTVGEIGGSGPDITVSASWEGLEGARVFLNSGSGSITASDDGVNAATDESVSEIAIYLNGGSWKIEAGGDGLDAGGNSRNNSGGNVIINGGVTEVYGASDNGNAALDYDGTCAYNGGTLLAVGMSGMAQAPGSGTCVLFGGAGMGGGPQMGGGIGAPQMENQQAAGTMGGMQNAGMGGPQMGGPQMDGWQSGGMGGQQMDGRQSGNMGGQQFDRQLGGVSITQGSAIEIKDSDGTTIYSATGVKNANSVVFCSEELTAGQTYTLYVDGAQVASAAAGSGQSLGTQPNQGQVRQPTQNQGQAPNQNQSAAPNQGMDRQPGQDTDRQPNQGINQQPGQGMDQGGLPWWMAGQRR